MRFAYARVLTMLAISASASMAGGDGEMNLLPDSGFDKGVAGWTQQGQAQFAHDREVGHTAPGSARITIPGRAPRPTSI